MTARPAGRLLVALGVVLAGLAGPVAPGLVAADAPEFEPTIVHARQGETAGVGIAVPEGGNDSYRLDAGDEETTTRDDTGTHFVYDGDAITLRNASGQVVRGETDLDPGTELVVRLQSSRNNFLRSLQVTVSESGTFAATVDMYDVAPGATFEARAIYDGTTLASADGRVVACSDGCDRTHTTTDATDDARTTLPADELAVQPIVEVTRTETARIPVTFGDADALTIAIGGESVNYVVTGTVRDADGDGRAVVRFHTESAGFDAPTLDSSDELELGDETSLSSTLDSGNYPVRVYRGGNASGDPVDVGRVVVYDAGGSAPTDTTDATTDTAGTTVVNDDRNTPKPADGPSLPLGGVGVIALGGVLAVVGIGVLLGIFRR